MARYEWSCCDCTTVSVSMHKQKWPSTHYHLSEFTLSSRYIDVQRNHSLNNQWEKIYLGAKRQIKILKLGCNPSIRPPPPRSFNGQCHTNTGPSLGVAPRRFRQTGKQSCEYCNHGYKENNARHLFNRSHTFKPNVSRTFHWEKLHTHSCNAEQVTEKQIYTAALSNDPVDNATLWVPLKFSTF